MFDNKFPFWFFFGNKFIKIISNGIKSSQSLFQDYEPNITQSVRDRTKLILSIIHNEYYLVSLLIRIRYSLSTASIADSNRSFGNSGLPEIDSFMSRAEKPLNFNAGLNLPKTPSLSFLPIFITLKCILIRKLNAMSS